MIAVPNKTGEFSLFAVMVLNLLSFGSSLLVVQLKGELGFFLRRSFPGATQSRVLDRINERKLLLVSARKHAYMHAGMHASTRTPVADMHTCTHARDHAHVYVYIK